MSYGKLKMKVEEIMKSLKNKKGFTLVELLAVIVILALIMAIAIYSISGILQSSRQSTFKDTAAGIIRGVRLQLTANNNLESGTYYFTRDMLESGATNPPFGGDYVFATVTEGGTAPNITYTVGGATVTKIGTGVYRKDRTSTVPTDADCTASTTSFVRITESLDYYICLTTGSTTRFIKNAKEADLLGSGTSMIVEPTATTG